MMTILGELEVDWTPFDRFRAQQAEARLVAEIENVFGARAGEDTLPRGKVLAFRPVRKET